MGPQPSPQPSPTSELLSGLPWENLSCDHDPARLGDAPCVSVGGRGAGGDLHAVMETLI